ncbi:O-antigen ligase family protein [Paenibacillus sp. GCM10012306]|uniref:O-antigen ligase family protein n=1 Tax=Paenibacillus sp. GCM10012306 TaxID=3317342 RepID=UPI00360C43BF
MTFNGSKAVNINKWKISFICILYDVSMIFYELLNNSIVGIFSAIIAGYLFFLFFTKTNVFQALFYMMIVFIPTSFVSIIGTSYGDFPLSWFTLISIILFLTVAFKGKLNKIYFLLLIFFATFCSITLFKVESVPDALKQILTICLFLFSFSIGEQLKKSYNSTFMNEINFLYIMSVVGLSLQVLMQQLYILNTGEKIGHYTIYGFGRITYAGLMNDFSFTTLYIATGAMLVLVLYFEEKKIKFYQLIIMEILFVYTILIVNSRTGLYVFLILASIYITKKIIKGNVKALSFVLIIVFSLPYIYNYIMISRGGQALFDGSGRIGNYQDALAAFSENFFMGAGFGLNNLYSATGAGAPHNFFLQYLAQSGIIGTLLLIANLIILFKKDINKFNNIRWVIYIILCGSMLIPDIVSSRFFSVVIVMAMISSQKNRREVESIDRV